MSSSQQQQQLEAGIAAMENQRATLGDAVVNASVAALRTQLAALRAGTDLAGDEAQALRQVTILFLDVVGSTALAQRLDPEEVSAVMDGALARGTTIVLARGGKVLQYAGDNILAAFGADEAAEDDAERAVRCGLALLELGRAVGAEVLSACGYRGFGFRVGVHTGAVLLGGGVDKEGTIRGSSVNIAARMEQTAPAGGLRISHDTYTQVRGVFDVEVQEPLAVKGVDTPVRSYLVLRAKLRAFRTTTRGIEGVATRMVGRDAELEALQEAFKRLFAERRLAAVTVVGEAGVGKSRLLYEFASWSEARPEAFYIFRGRATPHTQGQPFGLLRDILAWRFQIADDDTIEAARAKLEAGIIPLFVQDDGADLAEGHAHVLGHLIGIEYRDSRHVKGILDDPRQIRNRALHTAAQLLRRVSAGDGAPVVLQLEDLHWADNESLDFLNYLAEVNRDAALLILSFARPTLFERRSEWKRTEGIHQRIDVSPLDQDTSRLLADELLKKLQPIPVVLSDMIIGRAEGNPFYMEELVKMLIDQGAIRTVGENWTLDGDKLLALKVPPTLTGVLQARLDGLPRRERHALQLASVIGLNFWDRALGHIELRATEQLPALQGRELVNPKDVNEALGGDLGNDVREFAFRQQILHQVTYGTVLKATRRKAHAKAAEWLSQHSGTRANGLLLGAAARHFELAGDSANAAEHYARAAAQAAATFSHDTALDHTAQALKLAAPDDIALHWRLRATRERTLDMLGRRDEQMQDVEALLALAAGMPQGADGDMHRADAAWRRCDIALRTGDWPTQEREARRAWALAEGVGAEELALRAIQRLAQALAMKGDPEQGLAVAQDGLQRARALGSLTSQSRLVNAMAVCAAEQGDLVAALQYSLLDLSLSREAEHRVNEAIGHGNVAVGYLHFGDHARASPHLEEALKLNRALGSREFEGSTLGAMSDLALREGQDALALERAQASLDILTAAGSRMHLTDTLWSLGNAELALGRSAAASAAFERCEALASEIGLSDDVLAALAGQARVALASGLEDRQGAGTAQALQCIERLLAAAGAGATAEALAGAFDRAEHAHRIRLTILQAWARAGDPRADAALQVAHSALLREADRISDAALRDGFLTHIPEHREILALWARRQPGG
jgi:predicted ATPase/class 3 adenylate cyclase